MSPDYIVPKGTRISIESLRASKAKALADILSREALDFATLVECYADDSSDIVVFDVAVEVPQLRKNPINSRERLAAVFALQDDKAPEVLALRPDFPRVPHLNLVESEFPRSLCLYEELYRDLKSRWTAQRFVERVRQWLALTARGLLHDEDQPLEPLLSGYLGVIILPPEVLDSSSTPQRLYLVATEMAERLFLIAYRDKPDHPRYLPSIVSVHVCPPRQHGVIRNRPLTITDIDKFSKDAGLDLLTELRSRLRDWRIESTKETALMESPLVIVLVCPKTRNESSATEATDVWVFITAHHLKEVGKDIGIWDEQKGHIVPLIFPDETKTGKETRTDLLNTAYHLTRGLAAAVSNLPTIEDPKICAIGVGALGSQVVINLARSGLGTWCLIDDDHLMPHNVARHALWGDAIGYKKADAMALVANNMIYGPDLFSSITADVVSPKGKAEDVRVALANTDIILDMSASVTVARYLALNVESLARRVSLYLNPSGQDLVLLAEDRSRSIQLDELEMQFYRALAHDESLSGHYTQDSSRRRYGRSCRDVTSLLSQSNVALHAAIGTMELPGVFKSDKSQITVWRSHSDGTVSRVDVNVTDVFRQQIGEWIVSIDSYLLGQLRQLRTEKKPNETGGVLIGSVDLDRKRIYIIDTIPSPPDSEEWPTLYIRGSRGLKTQVDALARKTSGMLEYVGEWHSHPDGFSTAPSGDDLSVFSWLTEWMDRDGLPSVMMIVGQADRISCFVGQINREENLFQTGR
ncbi:MAG: Mov34/MPN/PAD-1 family protein [Nitrospirota bacterium]